MKKTLLLLSFAFAMTMTVFASAPAFSLADHIQVADATCAPLPLPANTPKVKNIRIREIVGGDSTVSYKIVVVVKHDDADQVMSVEVGLTPASPSSPTPSSPVFNLPFKAENSAKNKKRYVNKEITFGSSALGKEYVATVTMKDASGATVGAVETINVTVTDKADVVTDPATVTGVRIAETGLGTNDIMAFVTDPGNLVNAVRVEIIPISRTSPLPNPTTMVLPFDVQLPDLTKRFASYGGLGFAGSAIGHEYFVTITLLDANGLDLDTPITLAVVVV